jgi:hypothetical protein
MTRFKIWGFTALVVAIGFAGVWVFTQRAAVPALEQVSATLRSGALQFETGTRLLSRQVRDVAAVAARDPALASGLSALDAGLTSRAARAPGAARPDGAPSNDVAAIAEAAINSAAALLEVEMGRAPLVGSAHDRTVSLRVGDRRLQPGDALSQALLGSGAAPRHVRIGDVIYAVAVHHTDRGITLAFGLPIDPRWTGRLQAATGADLTFLGATPASSLSPADAAAVVAAATRGGAGMVDVGRLGPVPAAAGLPGLPLLFLRAPAFRARALALSGIEGPVAVLSAPARPSLEPIAAFQQSMLVALLALAIVGVGLGLAREPVVPSHVPRELAAVADRISRGDFEVRVPRMNGTFGTLAAALSRASETARLARIAQGAAVGPVHPPHPAPTLDVPLHAVPPEETGGAHRDGEPYGVSGLAPPATPTPLPVPGRAAHPLTAAEVVLAAQAARAGHPRTTMPIGGDGPDTPAPGHATPSPAEDEVDASWRSVHEEFLRMRSAQGEPVDGVSWDRFRDKLRKNRDLLVQKYACRTVRFQVYVKEGKTALRATPVR